MDEPLLTRNVNGLDSLVQREVFAAKVMPQEEVVATIKAIATLNHEAIFQLLQTTSWVLFALLPYVLDIAGGNVRKKKILNKQADSAESQVETELAEDELAEIPPHESTFLAACLVMYYSLVVEQDQNVTASAFLSSGLVRAVHESIIEGFYEATAAYIAKHREYNSLFLRWSNTGEGSDKLNSLAVELRVTEDLVGSDRFLLYGTAIFVRSTFLRIKRLREKITKAYRRIAWKMALKHSPVGGQLILDNFQNGCVGLVKAISYYDVSAPARFARYAKWWVRQAILLDLRAHSNFVRVQQNTWSTNAKVEAAASSLELLYGNSDDDSVVEKMLLDSGKPITTQAIAAGVEKIERVRNSIRTSYTWSLEHPSEDGVPLIDKIADEASPEQEFLSFAGLTGKERRYFFMLHGLMGKFQSKVSAKDLLEEKLKQGWIAVRKGQDRR